MKLFPSSLRIEGVCRNALRNFFSSFSSSSSTLTSETSSSVITEWKPKISSRRALTSPNKNAPDSSLYRRISPLGDPDISVVPVLDQWVRERRKVDKETLNSIIKSLKKFKRFKHALEISEWMTDKRYIPPTKGDIASRLHLIYNVHGLQKAEEFYNNVSRIFKGYELDTALMNFYARERSVEKAESMMRKLREFGRPMTALPYNILSNLYYSIGNWKKMEELSNEMEKNGIYGDKYSFTPRLRAYAATSDVEGLKRTMAVMESDPRVGMDCDSYIIAANVFFRAGLVEKGLELLKKVEEMAIMMKSKYKILNSLLRIYAKLGKKDEVYRIWNVLKKDEMYNTAYRSMISSLVKLNDVLGAERVFDGWETKGLSYDFRIPNDLIEYYIKNRKFEKAEVLLDCAIRKGGTPTFSTWYGFATGYIENGRVREGLEALKNAAFCCRVLRFQEPVKDKLSIFFELLEKKGRNVEEIEGFLSYFEVEGVFSSSVCEKLRDFIKNGNLES